jgi:hypothetical protein
MKFITTKKGLALLAVLAVAAVSAIGAYAYFTSPGTGSGTANAGSNSTTLALHASFTNGLVPGSSKSVTFTADNVNANTNLKVTTISFGSVSDDDTGSSADACNAYLTAGAPAHGGPGGDFTMVEVSSGSVVPHGTNDFALTGTGTLAWANNDAVDQTPCAGEPLTLNVTSN